MYQLAALALTLAILLPFGWFLAHCSAANARRVWLIAFTLTLGGGIAAMGAHAFVAKWGFRGDSPRDGLLYLLDGTANRPFVYRRLTPEIIRLATDNALSRLPSGAVDYLVESSALKRYRGYWAGDEEWTPRKAVAFHIAYFIYFGALFGTLLSAAGLTFSVRGSSAFEAIVTASVALSLVPLMFVGGGYLYDAPELFLWTTLLLALIRSWWKAVPFLFLLLVVNKESALLVVPAMLPILYRALGTGGAVAWTAFLGTSGFAWLQFVHYWFADAPGQSMEWWLPSNLAFWSWPTSYALFGQLFAPVLPAPRGANLLILTLILLPLRFGWSTVRSDLRLATVILTVLLVPLLLAAGYRDEIRNLSLLYPFLFLITVEGVHSMLHQAQPRAAEAA